MKQLAIQDYPDIQGGMPVAVIAAGAAQCLLGLTYAVVATSSMVTGVLMFNYGLYRLGHYLEKTVP
jgi:MFS superfamily sulfate permease-like transporter